MGLGHAGRMVSAAERLKKIENPEMLFSTYGPAVDFIRKEGFNVLGAPNIMWGENPDGSFSFINTLIDLPFTGTKFFIHILYEKKRIENFRPDVVVSDSRYAPYSALYKSDGKKRLDVRYIFVSNQVRVLFPRVHGVGKDISTHLGERLSKGNYKIVKSADSVLIPDLPKPYTISMDNLTVPEEIEELFNYVGPAVRVKPDELPSVERLREKYEIEPPFVFAAVSGPGISKKPILDALKKALPATDLYALLQEGKPGSKFEKREGKLVMKGWLDDRYEILKLSDIVISRPGLTTVSEIIRYGKAAIVIPTPNQPEQESNARSIERLGIGKMLPQSQVNAETLKKAILDLVDDNEIKRNIQKIRKIAEKYDGAEGIANAVKQCLDREE